MAVKCTDDDIELIRKTCVYVMKRFLEDHSDIISDELSGFRSDLEEEELGIKHATRALGRAVATLLEYMLLEPAALDDIVTTKLVRKVLETKDEE